MQQEVVVAWDAAWRNARVCAAISGCIINLDSQGLSSITLINMRPLGQSFRVTSKGVGSLLLAPWLYETFVFVQVLIALQYGCYSRAPGSKVFLSG
jgi:hypothetical protein